MSRGLTLLMLLIIAVFAGVSCSIHAETPREESDPGRMPTPAARIDPDYRYLSTSVTAIISTSGPAPWLLVVDEEFSARLSAGANPDAVVKFRSGTFSGAEVARLLVAHAIDPKTNEEDVQRLPGVRGGDRLARFRLFFADGHEVSGAIDTQGLLYASLMLRAFEAGTNELLAASWRKDPPVAAETLVKAGAKPIVHVLTDNWAIIIRRDGSARFGVAMSERIVDEQGNPNVIEFRAGTFDYDRVVAQLRQAPVVPRLNVHAPGGSPGVGVILDPAFNPAVELYALSEELTLDLFRIAFMKGNNAYLESWRLEHPVLKKLDLGETAMRAKQPGQPWNIPMRSTPR